MCDATQPAPELLQIPKFVQNFWNPKLAKRHTTPTGIPDFEVTLRQRRNRNSDQYGITSFLSEVWDQNEKAERET
jgi:hypothetical protein